MSVTIRYRDVPEQVFNDMMTGRQPFFVAHVETGDINPGETLIVREMQEEHERRTGRELTADVTVVRDVGSSLVAGIKLRAPRPPADIARRALAVYGEKAQLRKTIEECAELILAICHHDIGRAGYEQIAEEAGDVENMLDQVKEIVGAESVAGSKNMKLNRFQKILEAGQL